MRFNLTLLGLLLTLCSVARADNSFQIIAADPGKQLVSVAFKNGVLVDVHSTALPFKPADIVVRDASTLIVTSNQQTDDGYPSAIVNLSGDGHLHLTKSRKLEYPSGYASLDRTHKFLLASNYRTGDVSVYRLQPNGNIGQLASHVVTPKTFAHCVLTSTDNRYAYVPCVKNNNALYQFAFDAKTGKLSKLEPFDAKPPAMHGPRHIAYHPNLPITYFSNEQQLGVSVYRIADNGQLTDIQHAITIPRRSPYVQGERGRHASDLVVTKDGKWLFVAVRDFVGDDDSVFTFRIEDDGRLSQIARTIVGDIPWKLNVSPNENHLAVSESGDNQLAVFKIEPNGALSFVARHDWNASVRNMVVVQ